MDQPPSPIPNQPLPGQFPSQPTSQKKLWLILLVALAVIAAVAGYLFLGQKIDIAQVTPQQPSTFPMLDSSITLKGTANRANTGVYIFQVHPNTSGDRLFVYRYPNCTITRTHPNGETNCDVGTRFIGLVDGKAKLLSVLDESVKHVEITGMLREDRDGDLNLGSLTYIEVDSITVIAASPSTTPTSSVDTSSWKTYRNEKYGFELRYPKTWVADERIIDRPNYPGLQLGVTDPQGAPPGNLYIGILKSIPSNCTAPFKDEIGSVRIMDVSYNKCYVRDPGGDSYIVEVSKINNLYRFVCKIDIPNNEESCDQVLFSFKFINQ